jgi:hypothetical protein
MARSNDNPDAAPSHSFDEETPEAKARWFQSLSVEERMEMFCAWTDLALEVRPELGGLKDAQPVAGRVLVLELPRR